MEFVQYTGTPYAFLTGGLLALTFALGVSAASLSGKRGVWRSAARWLLWVLTLVSFCAVPFAAMARADATTAHRDEVGAAVTEMYDMALSEPEIRDLRYPLTRPTEEFVVYGSVVRAVESGAGYQLRDVWLAWNGDRLVFVVEDGGGYIPLPTRL